ncbi:hypothetical protein BLNAU_11615 [Blattamonas nauphoetae]|uniref:Uncharacterized protein n=1 Tax=Blattamonas nauphoetae TaxID=2049346 RepID=A0ABQ9XPQ0_9EUKA|nr:hypothetical protein BLNAU_11615 [Blattamonas nauphoetae]
MNQPLALYSAEMADEEETSLVKAYDPILLLSSTVNDLIHARPHGFHLSDGQELSRLLNDGIESFIALAQETDAKHEIATCMSAITALLKHCTKSFLSFRVSDELEHADSAILLIETICSLLSNPFFQRDALAVISSITTQAALRDENPQASPVFYVNSVDDTIITDPENIQDTQNAFTTNPVTPTAKIRTQPIISTPSNQKLRSRPTSSTSRTQTSPTKDTTIPVRYPSPIFCRRILTEADVHIFLRREFSKQFKLCFVSEEPHSTTFLFSLVTILEAISHNKYFAAHLANSPVTVTQCFQLLAYHLSIPNAPFFDSTNLISIVLSSTNKKAAQTTSLRTSITNNEQMQDASSDSLMAVRSQTLISVLWNMLETIVEMTKEGIGVWGGGDPEEDEEEMPSIIQINEKISDPIPPNKITINRAASLPFSISSQIPTINVPDCVSVSPLFFNGIDYQLLVRVVTSLLIWSVSWSRTREEKEKRNTFFSFAILLCRLPNFSHYFSKTTISLHIPKGYFTNQNTTRLITDTSQTVHAEVTLLSFLIDLLSAVESVVHSSFTTSSSILTAVAPPFLDTPSDIEPSHTLPPSFLIPFMHQLQTDEDFELLQSTLLLMNEIVKCECSKNVITPALPLTLDEKNKSQDTNTPDKFGKLIDDSKMEQEEMNIENVKQLMLKEIDRKKQSFGFEEESSDHSIPPYFSYSSPYLLTFALFSFFDHPPIPFAGDDNDESGLYYFERPKATAGTGQSIRETGALSRLSNEGTTESIAISSVLPPSGRKSPYSSVYSSDQLLLLRESAITLLFSLAPFCPELFTSESNVRRYQVHMKSQQLNYDSYQQNHKTANASQLIRSSSNLHSPNSISAYSLQSLGLSSDRQSRQQGAELSEGTMCSCCFSMSNPYEPVGEKTSESFTEQFQRPLVCYSDGICVLLWHAIQLLANNYTTRFERTMNILLHGCERSDFFRSLVRSSHLFPLTILVVATLAGRTGQVQPVYLPPSTKGLLLHLITLVSTHHSSRIYADYRYFLPPTPPNQNREMSASRFYSRKSSFLMDNRSNINQTARTNAAVFVQDVDNDPTPSEAISVNTNDRIHISATDLQKREQKGGEVLVDEEEEEEERRRRNREIVSTLKSKMKSELICTVSACHSPSVVLPSSTLHSSLLSIPSPFNTRNEEEFGTKTIYQLDPNLNAMPVLFSLVTSLSTELQSITSLTTTSQLHFLSRCIHALWSLCSENAISQFIFLLGTKNTNQLLASATDQAKSRQKASASKAHRRSTASITSVQPESNEAEVQVFIFLDELFKMMGIPAYPALIKTIRSMSPSQKPSRPSSSSRVRSLNRLEPLKTQADSHKSPLGVPQLVLAEIDDATTAEPSPLGNQPIGGEVIMPPSLKHAINSAMSEETRFETIATGMMDDQQDDPDSDRQPYSEPELSIVPVLKDSNDIPSFQTDWFRLLDGKSALKQLMLTPESGISLLLNILEKAPEIPEFEVEGELVDETESEESNEEDEEEPEMGDDQNLPELTSQTKRSSQAPGQLDGTLMKSLSSAPTKKAFYAVPTGTVNGTPIESGKRTVDLPVPKVPLIQNPEKAREEEERRTSVFRGTQTLYSTNRNRNATDSNLAMRAHAVEARKEKERREKEQLQSMSSSTNDSRTALSEYKEFRRRNTRSQKAESISQALESTAGDRKWGRFPTKHHRVGVTGGPSMIETILENEDDGYDESGDEMIDPDDPIHQKAIEEMSRAETQRKLANSAASIAFFATGTASQTVGGAGFGQVGMKKVIQQRNELQRQARIRAKGSVTSGIHGMEKRQIRAVFTSQQIRAKELKKQDLKNGMGKGGRTHVPKQNEKKVKTRNDRGIALLHLNSVVLSFLADLLSLGEGTQRIFHRWVSIESGRSAVELLVSLWWREERRLGISSNDAVWKETEKVPDDEFGMFDGNVILGTDGKGNYIQPKSTMILRTKSDNQHEEEQLRALNEETQKALLTGLALPKLQDPNELIGLGQSGNTTSLKQKRYSTKPLPRFSPYLLSNLEHPLQGSRTAVRHNLFDAVKAEAERIMKEEAELDPAVVQKPQADEKSQPRRTRSPSARMAKPNTKPQHDSQPRVASPRQDSRRSVSPGKRDKSPAATQRSESHRSKSPFFGTGSQMSPEPKKKTQHSKVTIVFPDKKEMRNTLSYQLEKETNKPQEITEFERTGIRETITPKPVKLGLPPHLSWHPDPLVGRDGEELDWSEFDIRRKVFAVLKASGIFDVLDDIIKEYIAKDANPNSMDDGTKLPPLNPNPSDIKSNPPTVQSPIEFSSPTIPDKAKSALTPAELAVLVKIREVPVFAEIEQWDAIYGELVSEEDIRPVSPDANDMMDRAMSAKKVAEAVHDLQVSILTKQEEEKEESAVEFFGSTIGGAKKLAAAKVDVRILREVMQKANPPHPIVFNATASNLSRKK